MTFDRLMLAAWLAAAFTVAAAPAMALDPIDFDLAAPAAASAQATDEDEEDAFFSSKRRRGSVAYTGSIAPAAPVRVAQSRPQVDVTATCRAVLADNTNLYNYKFLEGCKRAVAEANPRRFLTR